MRFGESVRPEWKLMFMGWPRASGPYNRRKAISADELDARALAYVPTGALAVHAMPAAWGDALEASATIVLPVRVRSFVRFTAKAARYRSSVAAAAEAMVCAVNILNRHMSRLEYLRDHGNELREARARKNERKRRNRRAGR